MTQYPGIEKACLLIALDNGGINRTRGIEKQQAEYKAFIAKREPEMLKPIDAWLSSLTEEQIDLVCSGGVDEPETIAVKADMPAFTEDLLNAYFEEVC